MLKKTITYTDFNGVERTEDFYFNFSKAEVMKMELGVTGGLAEHIQKIVQTMNQPELIKLFEDLVSNAYGEKSADGRRFVKNEQLKEEFMQTEAYSQIFMELATDADKAAEFVNGIVPADLANQAKQAEIANHPANKK